jgi:serine/threonine-protein kinase
VRVLDFGIARAADRITTTQAGTVKGRLAYMAPEQMEGGQVDRRADVWSLGVVLREALEGKRLFRRGTDAETMVAVTTEPLPDWTVQVAPKLQEIVQRALERDTSRRYVSARQMGADLMRFARAQPVPVDMADVSAWMSRLFPYKLEEKRLLLLEQAPEPRLDASGASPWPTALSSHVTPTLDPWLPQISGEYSYSGTQPTTQEQRPASRRAALALVGLVLGGAAGGAWFATHRSHENHQFAETQLARSPAGVVSSSPGRAPGEQAGSSQATPAAPTAAPPRVLEDPADAALAPTHAEAPSPSQAEPDPESNNSHRRRRRETERKSEAAHGAEGQATGTLLVACSSGWAEVYRGNTRLGTTPGQFKIPAGRQVITYKPHGTGADRRETLTISPDAATKLMLTTCTEPAI